MSELKTTGFEPHAVQLLEISTGNENVDHVQGFDTRKQIYEVTYGVVPPVDAAMAKSELTAVQNILLKASPETDWKMGLKVLELTSLGEALIQTEDGPKPATIVNMKTDVYGFRLPDHPWGEGREAREAEDYANWQAALPERLKKTANGIGSVLKNAFNRYADPAAAAQHAEFLGRIVL